MGNKKVEKLDVFEAATQEVLKRTVTLTEETINNANIDTIPIKAIKGWTDLKKEINSTHAERFNRVLGNLPDREFVRVYLKALEFVRPKIVRGQGDRKNLPDTTINIQVNYSK